MTGTFSIEPYTPNDHAACLRIFDSNTPRFFTREERSAFAAFLDALPGSCMGRQTRASSAAAA